MCAKLKYFSRDLLLAVPFSLALTGAALADDTWDFSSLTSSIDFSSVATGVLAVAALIAAVYAGIKGAKIILSFLKG